MKKYIITLGLIGLFAPIGIKAGSISLSCNDTNVTKGSSTTCTLSGSSSEEISAVSAQLSSTGGITISNVNVSSGWQGNGDGGSIQLYTDNNKKGGFGIATFTVNVNGEGTISAGGISFTNGEFNESSVSGKTVNIGLKEEPKQEPKQEIKQETKKETNTTTTNNTNTAQNTQTEQKEEKKNNDASLKEITLSNGEIQFDPNTFEYNIEVSNEIQKITINASANDSAAKVEMPSDLSLKEGINNLTIKVTAQDGTQKEYKINITRLDRVLSSDSSLKTLSISGYDIDFNTEKYVYDIGDIKTSSIEVSAQPTNNNAKVRIYGSDSIGKDDVIVVEVEAENQTKTEYIIYANNTAKEKKSSKIVTLIIWILLLISLGFNGFLVYKNYKKNEA